MEATGLILSESSLTVGVGQACGTVVQGTAGRPMSESLARVLAPLLPVHLSADVHLGAASDGAWTWVSATQGRDLHGVPGSCLPLGSALAAVCLWKGGGV